MIRRLLRRPYDVVRRLEREYERSKRRKAACEHSRRIAMPYRLHLGCGSIRFPGWINIDQYENPGVVDVTWDVTVPFPFPDGSCRLIYNEHLLEHLDVESGLRFLRECCRVLQPSGILRIAMPSLESAVEHYQAGSWRDQSWLCLPENQLIHTRAEMLNVFFRAWGHQWIYDREELHRRLREAGFESWRDCPPGSSEEPEFCNRERRPDSLLICEALK